MPDHFYSSNNNFYFSSVLLCDLVTDPLLANHIGPQNACCMGIHWWGRIDVLKSGIIIQSLFIQASCSMVKWSISLISKWMRDQLYLYMLNLDRYWNIFWELFLCPYTCTPHLLFKSRLWITLAQRSYVYINKYLESIIFTTAVWYIE